MKVLITGSEGYLAKNLAKKLSKQKIICYGVGRGNWKKNTNIKYGVINLILMAALTIDY